MIHLSEIEREYDPASGVLGRGILIAKEDLGNIDAAGFTPFRAGEHFDMRESDGSISTRKWRGWVRQEGSKHYVAAVEFVEL